MTNPNPQQPPIAPPHRTLRGALQYVNSVSAVDVNTDYLFQLVAFHEYNGHPDDECSYESSMRGDLEVSLFNALIVQERLEELAIIMLEEPISSHRYAEAYTEYHELVARYSK